MIFFWQSVLEREKVGEQYLTEIAGLPEMAILYNEDFDKESVRKVLSAITNKELLNTNKILERTFWNNNMWIVEDSEMFKMMIAPIKALSLDSVKDELNSLAEIPYNEIEVIFIPALKDVCYFPKDKIYVNFFKVTVDLFSDMDEVTIEGKSLKDFIVSKVLEMDMVVKK
jgi:hypothetical protein